MTKLRIPDCIPQNDLDCFYNKKWYQVQEISSKTEVINNFTILQDRIDDEMFDFIMNGNLIDPIYLNMSKLRESYFTRHNSSILVSIIDLIQKIRNISDLAETCRIFNFFDLNSLFTISISSNFEYPDIYSLAIGEIELSMESKEIYEKSSKLANTLNKILSKIYDYVYENWNYRLSSKSKFINDVIVFEYLFVKSKLSTEDSRNPFKTHHSMLYSDFLSKFDSNNYWSIIFDGFMKNNDLIFYDNQEYLTFLKNFLDQINKDSLIMVKNYLIYLLVKEFAFYTPLSKIFSEFSVREYNEKSKFMETFYSSFGYYLESIFESKHSNKEKNNRVKEMFCNMKNYCTDVFSTTKIFQEQTRAEALRKISSLDILVGRQKYFIDLSELPKLGDDFYSNIFTINFFYFLKAMKMIGQPKSKYFLSINNDVFSFMINAYYDPSSNLIYVPTAIIDDVFFNEKEAPIYNYGGLGTVIGHEMMHSFDKSGSLFDHLGHLNNWWTKDDYKKFNLEIEKVREHYSHISVDGMKINANHSISENIADICGVKLSLRTYIRCFMPNANLKDLSYHEKNHLKKFFQRWANVLRTYETDNATRNEIEFDEHSPGIVRMNAPFSHINEYYIIYNVKPIHENYLNKDLRITFLDE